MAEGEESERRHSSFLLGQAGVYSRLRKVGPGLATIQKDACRLMSEGPLYEFHDSLGRSAVLCTVRICQRSIVLFNSSARFTSDEAAASEVAPCKPWHPFPRLSRRCREGSCMPISIQDIRPPKTCSQAFLRFFQYPAA
jgi:hypothetical protein